MLFKCVLEVFAEGMTDVGKDLGVVEQAGGF